MTERSVYWSWNKCPENSNFQLQEVAWANIWKHYLMSHFNENITEVSASYSLWDAISSKTLENKKTGLVRARRALIGFGHQRQDTNEKKKGSTYKALKWPAEWAPSLNRKVQIQNIIQIYEYMKTQMRRKRFNVYLRLKVAGRVDSGPQNSFLKNNIA